MRKLDERITREANKEYGCTGRFWEGLFKSQTLLDESAVLACMAYVYFNPISAKIAKTLDVSDHTSIAKRVYGLKHKKQQPQQQMPFVGNPRQDIPKDIPFFLFFYCELADITGRIIRHHKVGQIDY